MGLWKPASIDQEPEVVLASWQIFEIDGSRHFCGYNIMLGEGRVSSRIEEFDPTTLTGKTRSGRVYSLEGPTGSHPDARYVWASWCRINGIDPAAARDVSREVVHDGHRG